MMLRCFCTSAAKGWYKVWPPILKQNINTLNFNRGRNIEWQLDGIQGRPRLRSVGKTSPVAKSISHFSKSNFQKDSVSSHTGTSKLRQGILTEYPCVGFQLHLSNVEENQNIMRIISCIMIFFFRWFSGNFTIRYKT